MYLSNLPLKLKLKCVTNNPKSRKKNKKYSYVILSITDSQKLFCKIRTEDEAASLSTNKKNEAVLSNIKNEGNCL